MTPALLVLCTAQLLVTLDFSIINVALPRMRGSLGLSPAETGWVVSAYALSFGGFLLVAGRAVDLLGPRRLFLAGLLVVGAASAVGGLAVSPTMVVAARAVQGLGAAILLPAALALIGSLFQDGAERTRALARLGGMGAVGAALGVVLGGVLTEVLSWRWTFLVNVPIVLGVLAIAPRLLPSDGGRRDAEPLDLAGALLGTGSLLLLLYALESARETGLASGRTAGALVGTIAGVAAFATVERHAPAPVLPIAVLRRRSVAGANAVALITTGTFLPALVLLSGHLQEDLGYSPLAAGLAFLPMTAVMLFCSLYVSRRLIEAFGLRRAAVVGLALLGLGLAELAALPAHAGYLGHVLPGLLFTGAGASVMFPVVFTAATEGAPPGRQGGASATVASARQLGAAAGAAVMIGTATAGLAVAFAIAVVAVLAGTVIAVYTLPPRRVRTPW